MPSISIIISTYNSESALKKVLISYNNQTFKDFEIIIADDGSTEKTKKLIDDFKEKNNLKITHVWHQDKGFRKTIILNKAILASKSDYLLFTDGDCIARKDFVETHIKYREKGFFLSGGYFKLPKSISEKLTESDIINQNCFDINWLINNGLKSSFLKNLKLSKNKNITTLLNFLTPTNASWNGHNASGWKKDILHVNGFNEEMQYGGEDRELGERLFNFCIKSKQIRYSAICVHIYHERGYVKPEMIKKNNKIRKLVKKNKIIITPYGIKKI